LASLPIVFVIVFVVVVRAFAAADRPISVSVGVIKRKRQIATSPPCIRRRAVS